MRTIMRSMLGLFVCLLLSVPVTALAVTYDDYFTLSVNNLGLTGDLVGVGVNYNGTSTDLIFTAIDPIFRIGKIGLNLLDSPTLAGSTAWQGGTSYANHYAQATDYTNGVAGYDGYGKFNNSFTPTATNDPSTAEGWSNAFETVKLTLDWGTTTVDSLAGIFTLNNMNKFAAVHVFTEGGLNTGYASTPIPAAAWLLGSGLIGLFGVRRRMQS